MQAMQNKTQIGSKDKGNRIWSSINLHLQDVTSFRFKTLKYQKNFVLMTPRLLGSLCLT